MSIKQINERLLTSEFKFGFELEAIVSSVSDGLASKKYNEYEDDGEMYLDDYMNDEVDYLINEYIYAKTRKGISGSSDIHSDSSVMGDGSDDWPFEYSSPILDAIPRNFAKVVKLLSSLDDLGIYTNNTCGFHHHISFKGMSYKDLIWVYCNLATDPDTADSLSEYDGFNMYDNDYAKWSDLAHLGNALIDRDWKNAAGYLTDSKYRVFRLHPQGTLEWRGPRNFLNEGNKQVIIGFYKLLNHLISNIKNYMDSKYLTGTTITKDEMFKNLDEYLESGTKEKIYDDIVKDKSYEKLIDRLSRNQYLIFKIMKNPEADKFFRKLAKKQTYQLLHKMLQLEANSVEMGYYSKQQIKDSMEYLRDVFADTTTREDTFISYCNSYKLTKYLYSQKDIDEFLKTLNDGVDLDNITRELIYAGYDVSVAKKPMMELMKKYPYNIGRLVFSTINYASMFTPDEIAKILVDYVKDIYSNKSTSDFWSGCYQYSNAIKKLLNTVNPEYKKEWLSVLQQLHERDPENPTFAILSFNKDNPNSL